MILWKSLPRSIFSDGVYDLEGTVLAKPHEINTIELGDTYQFEINGKLKEVKTLYIPPLGMMIREGIVNLHPIQQAANNVLKAQEVFLNEYAQSNHKNLKRRLGWYKLQIRRYLDSLAGYMTGKSGIVANNFLSIRCAFSVTAHCGINYEIAPDEVCIPEKAYFRFVKEFETREPGFNEEPWVLALRYPVLHTDGMRILKIKPHSHYTIDLHPAACPGMNADRDGDLIFVILGWPGMRVEHMDSLEYDGEMLLYDDDAHISDDPNVIQTTAKERSEYLLSLNPYDIILYNNENRSNAIKEINAVKSLDIPDIKRFCNGISANEMYKMDVELAHARCLEKLGIGPMGVRAQRARAICLGNAQLQKSANYLTERGSQALFDSKHSFSPAYQAILDVLNKRPSTAMDALVRLAGVGINPVLAQPFISMFYSNEHIDMTLNQLNEMLCPLTEVGRTGINSEDNHRRVELLKRENYHPLLERMKCGIRRADPVADQGSQSGRDNGDGERSIDNSISELQYELEYSQA